MWSDAHNLKKFLVHKPSQFHRFTEFRHFLHVVKEWFFDMKFFYFSNFLNSNRIIWDVICTLGNISKPELEYFKFFLCNFYQFVDVPDELFLWHIQNNFGTLLSSLCHGNLTNFYVSISHLCWVCRHQKFCRVSSDIICRQNFLEQPVFGFSNSLLYSLEESRRLRILISWILIWPQNLFHFEDVPI